jgi:hypothetical protein
VRIEYMIRTRLACLCFTIVPLAGCGGSTIDSIARKHVNLFLEVKDVLQDVTDEASAKAAVDKLKAIRDKNDALKAQLQALNPTPGDQKAIREKYEADYVELIKAIHSEETRIRRYPVLKVHLDVALKWLDQAGPF